MEHVQVGREQLSRNLMNLHAGISLLLIHLVSLSSTNVFS